MLMLCITSHLTSGLLRFVTFLALKMSLNETTYNANVMHNISPNDLANLDVSPDSVLECTCILHEQQLDRVHLGHCMST